MSTGLPTDPMNTHDEPTGDRVRQTLQAQYQATEARMINGMVAPRQTAPTSADSRPQSRWFLSVAAAVVVLVAVGGLMFLRGDDQLNLDTAGELDTTGELDASTTTLPSDEPVAYLRGNGYAVVQLEGEGRTTFAAVDINEGVVVETFWSDQLEATGFGSLELAADGMSAYLVQGFEDSWYSCESSLPSIVQLDLSPGLDQSERMTEIARGVEPQISLGGTHLAYLTASDCVPDPEQPEQWVVSVLDTIVVRELATGVELGYTVPGLVDSVNAGGDYRELDLRGLLWLGDSKVGVSGGEILAVDGPNITLTGEQLPVLIEPGSLDRLAGYMLEGREVLIEVRDPENPGVAIGVDSVSLDTGERLAVWPGDAVPAFDVDEFGVVAAVDTVGRRFYLGSATSIFNTLELPDGSTVSGELRITGYGW